MFSRTTYIKSMVKHCQYNPRRNVFIAWKTATTQSSLNCCIHIRGYNIVNQVLVAAFISPFQFACFITFILHNFQIVELSNFQTVDARRLHASNIQKLGHNNSHYQHKMNLYFIGYFWSSVEKTPPLENKKLSKSNAFNKQSFQHKLI